MYIYKKNSKNHGEYCICLRAINSLGRLAVRASELPSDKLSIAVCNYDGADKRRVTSSSRGGRLLFRSASAFAAFVRFNKVNESSCKWNRLTRERERESAKVRRRRAPPERGSVAGDTTRNPFIYPSGTWPDWMGDLSAAERRIMLKARYHDGPVAGNYNL